MQLDTWKIMGDGFHFGLHGMGQEESAVTFPSDSLFAALAARLAALEGGDALATWVEALRKDPPAFALTSAFPQIADVRLFPRPQRVNLHSQRLQTKDVKKVDYVSEGIFKQLVNGADFGELYTRGICLQGKKVLFSSEEFTSLPLALRDPEIHFWQVEQRPRVTVGRFPETSNLFFTGRTSFQPNCGLWFGVRWTDKCSEDASRLAYLLEDLGIVGLGGERSAGFGRARITDLGVCSLPDAGAGAWVSLSRYAPREDENGALLDSRAAYAIRRVGGWVYSPGVKSERRRTIHMLAEGSVLGPLPRDIPGQVVDVQPDYGGTRPVRHAVWRNGLAVAVGAV